MRKVVSIHTCIGPYIRYRRSIMAAVTCRARNLNAKTTALPSAVRASSTNLGIQYARSSTCICSSGVLTGASPAVSTVDARAVAQSLHTRIPQAIALLVFSGMRVSLSYSLVASFMGNANQDDSAIALSVSPSRALATHSKTYLESDWLKVT